MLCKQRAGSSLAPRRLTSPWEYEQGENMPDIETVKEWIGYRVDDVYGARVGRLENIYVDDETREPKWLVVRLGRFNGESGLVPIDDCVVGAGHVWVPFERAAIRQTAYEETRNLRA